MAEQREEYRTYMKTGIGKAITMLFYKNTMLKIKNGLPIYDDPYFDEHIQRIYKENIEMETKEQEEKSNTYYLFITIRPKDNTIQELKNFMEKFTNYIWTKERCEWVYEQEGNSEMELGQGLHTHLLLDIHDAYYSTKNRSTKLNKKNVLKNLKDKLLHFNINCPEPDIKEVPFKYADDKREYMFGTKTGDNAKGIPKKSIQLWDKIWRKNLNIQEKYSNISGATDKSDVAPETENNNNNTETI